MIRIQCVSCGCLARMTRKWLADPGPPTCACGGYMSVRDWNPLVVTEPNIP